MRKSEVKLEQENKTGCLFYVSPTVYILVFIPEMP